VRVRSFIGRTQEIAMVVFESGDGNVWRVNRDGSHATQLTFDGQSLNPSYTPDGHNHLRPRHLRRRPRPIHHARQWQ
jgi:hypothetical protein